MIVSIGEVVWDIFGDRKVLGGAPINVAYHLQSLDMEVRIITKIGKDPRGRETKKRLKEMGLSLDGVQEGDLPTGEVYVTIGSDNEPHFDIAAPAAWDAIDADEAAKVVGDEPFHLVFGTLAQRDERSRRTIRELWEKAAARFYDVNLRPPFTNGELVIDSLKAADMVKVNADELGIIASWHDLATDNKQQAAQQLLQKYDAAVFVVTEGSQGAWLVTADEYFEHPGVSVQVADTVGSGDAFFATLIEGYINSRPWTECLARANRRGAYVASQNGATPPMPE
jgi:fructokinase